MKSRGVQKTNLQNIFTGDSFSGMSVFLGFRFPENPVPTSFFCWIIVGFFDLGMHRMIFSLNLMVFNLWDDEKKICADTGNGEPGIF